jgi:hypothetical protein
VTRDIDLTLLAGFGNEDRFAQSLLAVYEGRIEDAAAFAQKNRVLLLRTPGGLGIDVSLGGLPFEETMMDRATVYLFGPELGIRTCSAEDLVIMKLFALRPTDVRDAEGVVARQGNRLDWKYIEDQLRPLAEIKNDPAILATLERLQPL